MANMLNIDDLKVSLEEEEKQIIKGLSLSIKPGEVHAIMGPNGSGKSTLSSVLAGKMDTSLIVALLILTEVICWRLR